MQEAVKQVLTGKEKTVELVMIALVCNGHLLVEDVPGTGKTLLAKTIAKLINARFTRIQLTPDVLPGDITGVRYFNPKTGSFTLQNGPVMTNILLADEINRATPKTQSSLLEAMEERQVTIEGETLPLPRPFLVFATQNPIESSGTFPLPEAQLDRFFLHIDSGYPDRHEEKRMLRIHRAEEPLAKVQPLFSTEEILSFQKEVKKITLSEVVEDYLLDIVRATRNSEDIEVGVSPRGTLAFMRAAQGKAWVKGRDYVIPEDVKQMAPFVLAHRLVLSLEAEMRKKRIDVLQDLIHEIDVPVEHEGADV